MTCAVTRIGSPIDVTHIFPSSMQHLQAPDPNSADKFGPWKVLRMFWTREKVDRWYNAVARHGTETIQNVFCLSPHVHRFYESVYFALKPLSVNEQKDTLVTSFYWLPHVDGSPDTHYLYQTFPIVSS